MYSSGANHRRYQCGRWYRKRDVKCISMSAAKADGFVISYMKKLLNEDIDFEELAVGYNQQAAMADHDFRKSLEELEKKEADLVAKIARATRAIMEGSPLAEELERQSSIVSKELEETREKIIKLKNNVSVYMSAEILEKKFSEYRQLVVGDYYSQRLLVEEMIGKVIIYEGGYIDVLLKGESESNHTRELYF